MPEYQLHLGDCVQVMSQLDECSIDLTITSPPYDKLRKYKGHEWNFEDTAKQLYRITKEGGVLVWVVNDATVKGNETGTSFKQALYLKEIGFNLHDTMIYKKNAVAYPTFDKYYPCFEYMFVFSKGKPKTINLLSDRQNKQASKRVTGNERQSDGNLTQMSGSKKKAVIKDFGVRWNVWEYNTGWQHSYKEDYLRGHPAIFPEKLAQDHILSWSNEGDTVLDCFLGSGTTGKMALLNKRKFVGIEIAPEYFTIASNRILETARSMEHA